MPLSFVLVGHVDAGKSTLAGHLLVHVGGEDQEEWRRLQGAKGLEKQKFSALLDVCNEERERGKTSDYTIVPFEYKGREYCMIDTPGHRQFIRCMVEGASVGRIDVGVCIVSVRTGEYESGIKGQTLEHLAILRGLGVKQLVVCLNKTDLVERERVEEVREAIKPHLKKLGFKATIITISAWKGWGLDDLMEALNKMEEVPEPKEPIRTKEFTFKGIWSPCGETTKIKTAGYRCMMHSLGNLVEVEIAEILGDKQWFIKGTNTVRLICDSPTLIGRNVILRQGEETVAIGIRE